MPSNSDGLDDTWGATIRFAKKPFDMLNTSAKAAAVPCNWLVMWRLQARYSNAFKSQSERMQAASMEAAKKA